jgi:hypothetical protein
VRIPRCYHILRNLDHDVVNAMPSTAGLERCRGGLLDAWPDDEALAIVLGSHLQPVAHRTTTLNSDNRVSQPRQIGISLPPVD